MNIQDITSLYQLAQQADIKAGQAVDVAQLFQRIEQFINAEVVRSHVEAAMAQKAAAEPAKKPDSSTSTAVAAAPTAASSTPPKP